VFTGLLQRSDQSPPTPRCKAYEQLGISRAEGRRLAQSLGLGKDEPFTPEQIKRLRDSCDRLVFWRERGLSLEKFCKQLEQEIQGNG
jgi:hypothetical protein